MVPLALADRLSVPPAGAVATTRSTRPASTRAPPRTTSRCGRSSPPAPPPSAPGAGAAVRGPPREGDPRRRGPRGRQQRRRRGRRRGALEARGAELDDEARVSIALGLGSDVPFFLAGGAALVEGPRRAGHPGSTGSPTTAGAPAVLLVTPPIPAHTAAGVRGLVRRRDGRAGGRPPDVGALRERVRLGADRPRAARAGRRARLGQRPVAGRGGRAPGSSRCGAALTRLTHRPIGLSGRARRSGRSILRWTRPAAATMSARPGPPGSCRSPATASRSSPRPRSRQGGATHDPTGDLDRQRAGGARGVQPGDPERRHGVLRRSARHGSDHRASSSKAGSRPRPSGPSRTS